MSDLAIAFSEQGESAALDVTKTRKVSVTFERRKDLGNYDSVVARAWVEGNVSEDATASQVTETLQDLFISAAAAVLDQLGIEAILDDNGTLRERFTPVVTEKGKSDLVARNVKVDGDLRVMNQKNLDEQGIDNGPLPEALFDWAAKNNVKAVWDQRHEGKAWQFREAVPRDSDRKPKFYPPRNFGK